MSADIKRRFATLYLDHKGKVVAHGAASTIYGAVAATAPKVFTRFSGFASALVSDRLLEISLLEVLREDGGLVVRMTAEAKAAERGLRRVK